MNASTPLFDKTPHNTVTASLGNKKQGNSHWYSQFGQSLCGDTHFATLVTLECLMAHRAFSSVFMSVVVSVIHRAHLEILSMEFGRDCRGGAELSWLPPLGQFTGDFQMDAHHT